ncbi:MAG: peptidyl-prolyl cis-trans isomerase [candidate division WOR-3 bacterium]|nr:MAG: peptidyl-prolyl cis-trans isomerase [candidate division WOR-3 bacterium]
MMQTLRKKTRLVLFIALAFFAGLIFFQWGLDITGIRGRPERDIAKIGDRTITYQEYRSFAMARESENRNITSDEIWNMLIEEFVWRDLAGKERIGVNDNEIWAIIKSNPPPQIYNSEFMQNEQGEFDWNKYSELIKSPQSLQWLYEYEMQLRRNLPKEKLRSLVSTMAWVSPFEDSLALYGQTVAYDISFLSLQVVHLRGSITIDDEEVADYYNEHRDEFATPEYKVLKYVFFDRKPSPGDTLEARERLEDLIALVSEGEDFLQLAREVSDDTTIEYSFENENILRPYMREVYKKLRNGEVSGVVPAARGFEVMKRVRDGLMYVAKANVQVSRTTVGEITDNIAAFVETAEDIGFDSAAVDLDIAVRRTYPLGHERSTFPVRNVEGLSDFVEKVKPGDISNPFSSLGGYYVFALDSVVPAQKPSLEESFPRVKAAIENEEYGKLLTRRLEDVHAQLMSGRSMEDIAVSDTVVKFQGGLRDQNVHVLRNMHGDEFAGALISLEPGQMSKPVIARYSGYIIRCDRKEETPVDSTMAGMLQWSRQMRLQHISQVLFTPEKLVDNRDLFFE